MAVEVKFCIQLRDGTGSVVQEQEIEDQFEFYAPTLHDLHMHHSLEGAVIIQSPAQQKIEIWDELWVTVQNLCFRSVDSVLVKEDECFLYRYQTWDGHLVLVPTERSIYIFGDDCEHVPVTTFNKSELLIAFYHCGQRYLDLLQRLESVGRSGSTFVYPELKIEAEKAKEVLEMYKLL